MRKAKLIANLMITIVLAGLLAGISIYAVQSSGNSKASETVFGQSFVSVSGAYVSASGDNGDGVAVADHRANMI